MFAGVHAVRCARKMHKPLQLRSRSCLDDRQVNTMKLAPPDKWSQQREGFIFSLHPRLQQPIALLHLPVLFFPTTWGSFYTLTITTLTMLAAWYIEGKPEGGRPGCCPEAPREEGRRQREKKIAFSFAVTVEMSPRSVRGAEPMVVKNKISKALWHVYGILVI
ncbi:uncharacterized protein GLRG_00144 [Colletotrichum graminicola M1.001]|uniref:Uncharacterized protein n=1 Tax=Colletotrichum graminicola (strain M1.001 / M2 / FGSC 10212) TaxID=645133 RepID=E3Q321_COLGM|nr:uncharacterized protein GLRG_00144 [Colletotrichum graminicola M1.001]EFQ25000.1 hypothetical protein GLRG_00144 [Colletotrichum graminicola M1.001]